MYNDHNNDYTNRNEENGENNYSGNGYRHDERTYVTSYENTQEQNGYDPNRYNTSSYNTNSYDTGNGQESNGYVNPYAASYSSIDATNNDYSTNNYSGNGASGDYNYNGNGNGYDTGSPYATGYDQESPQYMDLLDKSERLSAENDDLNATKRVLRVTLVLSLLLLVASIGYLVYSEVKQPLFGKWPQMAREYEIMAIRVDTLDRLKQQYDSLREANNILVENATPSIQAGVFFEVQIGAFQNFDLQKYGEDLARLRGETEEGMNKYVLGRFRNYKRAEAFKNDVQRMGVSDAFIVATIDGRRVEVIEAIKASKRIY